MPSSRLQRPLGLARVVARAYRVGLSRRPRPVSLDERLAMFPRRLPVSRPVEIHWDRHAIPHVEARDDRDLAVALGAVHGHLRLAQIEFMRLLADGRLATVVGQAAVEVDHLLRLLDLGRAVPEMEAHLPDESRQWMEGFADGLNAAVAQVPVPLDLEMAGVRPRPWSVADLLRLSRLASMDFTWKVWLRLLPLRHRSAWTEMWQRLVGDGLAVPGMAGGGLDPAIDLFSRPGSNCFAVDGRRTASGRPLLAADPHLPIVMPNTWLAVGFTSPSHNACGLMIPGLPALGLGRSPWGAWGGTSLHAASSDLFDVSEVPDAEIEREEIEIPVRGTRPRRVTLRRTAWGPIVSDAARLGADPARPLALKWVGHAASDELTALLGVQRARGWADFVAAMDGFALPAQNMLFAAAEDAPASGARHGRVGQIMAAHLPRRPVQTPGDMLSPLSALEHWDEHATASSLPQTVDPACGFVASANNAPEALARSDVVVSHFFSSNERIARLKALLDGNGAMTPDHVAAIHGDVTVPSGPDYRDRLLGALDHLGEAPKLKRAPVLAALAAWDGSYREDSAGALAFELLVFHLVSALHGEETLGLYLATWDVLALLRQDLERTEPPRLAAALERAVAKAQPAFAELGTWGAAHRLELAHPFARLPGLGRRFRPLEGPVGGGNETLMKTGFGFTGGRHKVKFGANARFVADLSEPDANRVALLGGQDGWIGSAVFDDQVALWRRLESVPLPLRAETARANAAATLRIEPEDTA